MEGSMAPWRAPSHVSQEPRAKSQKPDTPPTPQPAAPKPRGRSPSLLDGDDALAFEGWWSLYPRKVGKGGARQAFKRARGSVGLVELNAATKRFAQQVAELGTEERFIPHPATWLNGERWADGRAEPQSAGTNAESGGPDDLWRTRMRAFQANGAWPERHFGPKPGQPGCKVPVQVLREFGYQPAEAA